MARCEENIFSEDILDYIIENIPASIEGIEKQEFACFQPVDSHWLIAYGPLRADKSLTVSSLGYFRIPKVYGLSEITPQQLSEPVEAPRPDTTSMDKSGATQVLNIPLLSAKGQGVIIGIIDTGIDYLKNNFIDISGSSRIQVIWDQTLKSDETAEPAVLAPFGRVYGNNEINRAIVEYNEGRNPYDIVATVDENGHGTFLAGVCASSQVDGYFGVAPMSELAVVKLKQAKQYLRDYYFVNDSADAYSEADIMLGVSFLRDFAAAQGKPLVILIGLSCAQGARNGGSPLADVLDNAAKRQNTAVVASVGNEAMARTHFSGLSVSFDEPQQVEVSVSKESKGFILELWAEGPDVLAISVVSPSGEVIPRIPVRMGVTSTYSFLFEQTTLVVDYSRAEALAGLELVSLQFVNPADGIWTIYAYSLTNLTGRFNAWLPLKQFMTGEVNFIRSNADTTITEPSSAHRIISVGSYNHYTDTDDVNSGRGYTTDQKVKPDIVAPGVDVYGPSTGRGYTRKSGASVGAAHAAGAAALLLDWGVTGGNNPYIGNSEVKAMLIRGAKRSPNTLYPNKIQGYGRLDILESFNQMRIS